MRSSGFLILCFVVATSASGIIDARLKNRYKLKGAGGTENVLISFTPSIKEVIDEINGMPFASLAAKRTALTNAQQVFTKRVQGSIQSYLTRIGVKFEPFWINNKMVIKDAGYSLVQTLTFYPGVAKVEPEPVAELSRPNVVHEVTAESDVVMLTRQGKQSFVPWGIHKVRADLVWKDLTGKGVVVAGIDTGVRYTHEAVRSGWRRNYGWFDPAGKTTTPNDQNGHGTHTMGTIVGRNGVGVAPGATWIACKGCSSQGCEASSLISCGQWVQCPTRTDGSSKNCEMAPALVSNSWGAADGGSENWYDDVISSWQASGIVPVFANGNSGPACKTTYTPGGRGDVISVGSTDAYDKISSFSSLGPSADGKLKPDIVAPGTNVRSSWPTSDSAYATFNGTSLACPHVSGVIALMFEKNPNLTYRQVYSAITSSAVRNTLDSTSVKSCGSTSPSRFPNNIFGYGRIDAINSVKAV